MKTLIYITTEVYTVQSGVEQEHIIQTREMQCRREAEPEKRG